jgi:putative membrane protein
MKQSPILKRQFLYSGIYLAWWITLLSFILSGAYRSFIRPSFVIFLWGALVILLVFTVSGIKDVGRHKLRIEDVVRGGIFLLPLMALWMAYGKPLGAHIYMKKAITAQSSATRISLAGGNRNTADKPSAQPELRRNNTPAPLPVSILDLSERPHEYQGKWITTEGMALRQETFSRDATSNPAARQPGTFILFRFLIVCCVADSQPLGVAVKYAKAGGVIDNDWYRVTGRFTLNKDKIGVISNATVSNLKTPPDPPYLY